VFSYIGTQVFPIVFGAALAFALTNVGVMLLARDRFLESRVQTVLACVDVVFIAGTLYLLRVENNYLYLAFILIVVLAVLWRDMHLVLFSLFAVSLLYGAFSYFRFFRFQLDVNIEEYLRMALFFVVAMFYVFLSDRLTRDARLSNAMMEENRVAELMVEMSRALSSSLNTDEILYSIVSRLREVLDAEECAIFRIDATTGITQLMMKASQPEERNITVDLEQYPELKHAYQTRQLLYVHDAEPMGIIAIPMVVNGAVLGLIDVRSKRLGPILTSANGRFLEVMASTAANALRNAQLFEEVEQRARTDSLTGLPNHRFFHSTLTVELERAQRHDHTLSLLMVDLDFLKKVNDRYGHPSGDMVIRTIADVIRSSCRQIDFPARYGGEEFTVILPETPLMGAVQLAERLCERIAAEQFPGIGNITASIGISNYPLNALNTEDLIRIADQALYVAKNKGRDQVAYFQYQMITK